MARKQQHNGDSPTDVVERGNIYFIYRPRVEHETAEDFGDVERFYVVLKPEGHALYRSMIVGQKKLPDVNRHERFWGFVDKVAKSPKPIREEFETETYGTKTRGERLRPAARAAGEAVYALVRKEGDLHLIYALELPEKPSAVQKAFHIGREGSFVLSIKNPERGSPQAAGLSEDREADYPKSVQKVFRDRKFETEDPRPLDYEGAEFVLIGAHADPERETGIDLKPEHEELDTAEIVRQLRFKPPEHPAEPLVAGRWA